MKDYYSYIESYHKGQLSESERSTMEKAMQADAELKAAVENYPTLEPALEYLMEEDIRSVIEGLGKAPKKRVIPIWRWVAAAGAALLLGFGIWQFGAKGSFQSQPLTEAELFAMYYEAPMEENVRSGGNESSIPNTLEKKYLEAHALLQNNEVEAANTLFKELLGHAVYKDRAEWFLILSALKENDKNKAIDYLNQLNISTHTYTKQLERLKTKL